MGEVSEFETEGDAADFSEARKADIHEILKYRAALRLSEKMLEGIPLCQRVICEAHKVLLSGVRGHNKAYNTWINDKNNKSCWE
ncbi:MAG: hypothetical protein HQM08_07195 [Candidatus Riflebacteria bacterium]|nr:hypothetical protein [Candidatus Riflebacteria bacterium]